MEAIGFIISHLLDVRAHIPSQPSFGTGPAGSSRSPLLVRAVAFLLTWVFVLTLAWLAMRFVAGLL
jgi:hypothetical protein